MFSSDKLSNSQTRRAFLAGAAHAYLGVNLLSQDSLAVGGEDRKIPSRKKSCQESYISLYVWWNVSS